ncbi:MAG: OsmC family protein [Anaerolineae bacterium]|jgi:putative redox protein
MSEQNGYDLRLTWVDGMRFVAHAAASGSAMVLDGAPEYSGLGSAIRPMEALLSSLAGCTAMDVISILRKKRQQVTGFYVNVNGYRADEHPRRYERIELEYVVCGHGVSEEAVARSIELSLTKYCSVTATLNAEIISRFRVKEEGTEEQDE